VVVQDVEQHVSGERVASSNLLDYSAGTTCIERNHLSPEVTFASPRELKEPALVKEAGKEEESKGASTSASTRKKVGRFSIYPVSEDEQAEKKKEEEKNGEIEALNKSKSTTQRPESDIVELNQLHDFFEAQHELFLNTWESMKQNLYKTLLENPNRNINKNSDVQSTTRVSSAFATKTERTHTTEGFDSRTISAASGSSHGVGAAKNLRALSEKEASESADPSLSTNQLQNITDTNQHLANENLLLRAQVKNHHLETENLKLREQVESLRGQASENARMVEAAQNAQSLQGLLLKENQALTRRLEELLKKVPSRMHSEHRDVSTTTERTPFSGSYDPASFAVPPKFQPGMSGKEVTSPYTYFAVDNSGNPIPAQFFVVQAGVMTPPRGHSQPISPMEMMQQQQQMIHPNVEMMQSSIQNAFQPQHNMQMQPSLQRSSSAPMQPQFVQPMQNVETRSSLPQQFQSMQNVEIRPPQSPENRPPQPMQQVQQGAERPQQPVQQHQQVAERPQQPMQQQSPEIRPPQPMQQHQQGAEIRQPQPVQQQSPEIRPPQPVQQQSPEIRPPQPMQQQSPEIRPPQAVQQQSPEIRPPQTAQQQSPETRPPQPVQQQSPEIRPPQPVQQQSPEIRPPQPAQQHVQSPEIRPPQPAQQSPEIRPPQPMQQHVQTQQRVEIRPQQPMQLPTAEIRPPQPAPLQPSQPMQNVEGLLGEFSGICEVPTVVQPPNSLSPTAQPTQPFNSGLQPSYNVPVSQGLL